MSDTIQKTAEAILAANLEDGEDIGVIHDYDAGRWICYGDDLNALARAYLDAPIPPGVREWTELLQAAKRFIKKGVWQNAALNYADVVDDDEFARLRLAVEAAEKPADIVPPDPEPTT